jgi:two-component sensor histidine kinase
MDALLQHAVQHGRGAVRVSVSEEAEYAEVRVSHEAPRDRAAGELRKGLDAAGLARAREIAESLGGRLRLGDDPTTTFSLVLPLPQRETVAP